MIAALRGRLMEKHPARLIVDVSGVGYDVQVPLSTYGSIGDVGSDVTLRVHTHVREEQIALFGFLTALEQQIFERLISVNGIGPKVALAVLSGIAPGDLVASVQGNEPARLTTIPGIGRKTAERIIEYRTKSGGFKRIEDLMNVKGIGEKSFLKLKPLVAVPLKTDKAPGD